MCGSVKAAWELHSSGSHRSSLSLFGAALIPLGGGLLTRFGGICMSANPASGPDHGLTIEQSISPDGTLTLVCCGRITRVTASHFRSEVKNLASQHKVLLADLSAVHSIDSAGLGIIVTTYISAKSRGCDLMLVNVRPHVKDLLNITNLTSFL